MGVWNSVRRFAEKTSNSRRLAREKKQRRAARLSRPRDLRVEQFEDRVLLNIGPTNIQDDTVWQHTLDLAIQRAANLDNYTPEMLAGAHQWVVGLSDAVSESQLAASLGADSRGSFPQLGNAYLWQFDTSTSWQVVSSKLDAAQGVKYFYPLVKAPVATMSVPNDPLFVDQWHLLNTGQNSGPSGVAGQDADVTPVWNFAQGTGLGTGVQIGIVDDGLQYTHPDLSTHYRSDLSYDFNFNDPDPIPDNAFDNHGTAVAGVAAATGNNNVGVSGVAPGADLAGIRLISSGIGARIDDAIIGQALTFKNQEIDVYNNSWGPTRFLYDPGPLSLAALRDTVTNGRGGLGSIIVFAAGNDYQELSDVNYEMLNSSRYVIPVAAIGSDGKHSYYSTQGAALLVSGYSNNQAIGITTTDRTGDDGYNAAGAADGDPIDPDYTSQFGGTSSATPLVSGVVALMLEANPNLTWRDVQQILVKTAKKNDPTDPGWITNGAGYHVNYLYGFGAVDAAAAVNMARGWQNVGPEQALFSGVVNVGAAVPDNYANGVSSTITMGTAIGSIEHVEVMLDLTPEQQNAYIAGDLEVVLTAPSGTTSILAREHRASQMASMTDGYDHWVFTSTRHWGEASGGDWTLTVRDRASGITGRWNTWSLTLYGQQAQVAAPELISVIPNKGSLIQDGAVLNIAPRELTLRFNEGQVISPATLGAIQVVRSGGDGVFGPTGTIPDVTVPIGDILIGDRPNEVIVRFAENLPDDFYRINIIGSGGSPLTNIQGVAFHGGEDLSVNFELDLGPQVVAVVPQPVTRVNGVLQQSRNTIDVYFNDDKLTVASAENPEFYTLLALKNAADPTDDVAIHPTSAKYTDTLNKVVLTFAQDLANYGTGSFRLRIGDAYQVIDTKTITPTSDPGSSYLTAYGLGTLGAGLLSQSQVISAAIDPQPYLLEWPGAIDEPGHRDLPNYPALAIEDHYSGSADAAGGVPTIAYNFRDVYGTDPQGNVLHNLISEAQKQRTREIFELYSRYLGVQFEETPDVGLTIVTGDTRALAPTYPTGPNGIGGIAGGGMAIMNSAIDWGNSPFGGGWFTTAMHEIGHLLGLGHSYDMPPGTIMGSSEAPGDSGGGAEPVFPGDEDIVHGQYLWRPDSNDIDLYKFTLDSAGTFSAETIAQRLADSSLLNSTLTLFDSNHNVVARNDDYFGKDSYLKLHLDAGTYYIGVSASGNDKYDPQLEGTGLGGTTQGPYDLRVNFEPDRTAGIVDRDGTPTLLDGDMDGVPGGIYNMWFNVQTPDHVLFVDKASSPQTGPLGSLTNPYTQIDRALAAAQPGDIVRIVGNGGADGNMATVGDNKAYEIGRSLLNQKLSDGEKMEIPKGVTVMIDAGAVFKLRGANIDVGSSTQNIDRSLGALQVLGIPGLDVVFTSYHDESVGVDTEPLATTPDKGDWGGLVFRNNIDYDEMARDPNRRVLETAGIFLDYINHADIRYGGGEVTVNGVRSAYAPIHTVEARPTITFNKITKSADAAISADPNSFLESKFESDFYTADYDRVGPDVHGNYVVDNSINGLFVRIRTQAGMPLDKLEVPGRFDDLDIVYVISENLVIAGEPGGPIERKGTSPLVIASRNSFRATSGQGLKDQDYFSISDGVTTVVFEFDNYGGVVPGRVPIRFNYTDSPAQIATAITDAITLATQTLGLNVSARCAGDLVTVDGPVVVFGGFATMEARTSGRLAIDPGAIVKLDGARIETEISGQFIAEGSNSYPIIFTSLFDDRYGAGGTFDTSNDQNRTTPNPGDWASLYFGPASQGSIDYARVYYAGGNSTIEGGFANFNPVEIRQAHVRVANSLFEDNAAGFANDRNGRGPITQPATIHVRGAQPVIVNNTFRDNQYAVMSIDVNSLKADVVPDWGRSTGTADVFAQFSDNHGPLVRKNRFAGNGVNGMVVRGGTLTTDVIWDDTDIVHVVYDEIKVPNFHTYGVLRLQSNAEASLVVKLMGQNAGFTATGRPLEIDDRIGGTIQIEGVGGHPVVLTSLADDTVGAGFDPWDRPQFDTDNAQGAPRAGDWRSVRLEKYSNDRNVASINELERPFGTTVDQNGQPSSAQYLGSLATTLNGGDDVLRLGFQVQGNIRYDAPDDADVYSFDATAGTEVWFDIDRTTYALDTIIELIDANGQVLAWSDNSGSETAAPSETIPNQGLARPMQKDSWQVPDYYTINPRDAGMRVILPGPAGQVRTYYVRVRAAVRTIDALPGSLLEDGQTFTLNDGTRTATFEFEDKALNNGVRSGNFKIEFNKGDSKQTVADAIVAAITAANTQVGAPLNITAQREDAAVVVKGPVIYFSAGTTALKRVNPTGAYMLEVRLRELQELAGSAVSHANISYATNGVELFGQPVHSPLAGESAETTNNNETSANSQNIGNLVVSDREALAVGGNLSGANDVDFYRFGLDLTAIQSIGGVNDRGSAWPVTIDVDYADGMGRPDTQLWVFDQQGRLVFTADDSNVTDDQPAGNQGNSATDLTRGSFGKLDPYLGSVYLPEGNGVYYDMAITGKGEIPAALDFNSANYQPLLRREPVDSLKRIAEDHIGSQGGSGVPVQYPLFPDPTGGSIGLNVYADDFHLGDVVTYVNTGDDLYTINPFTGALETDVTGDGRRLPNAPSDWYGDIAMRNDGHLKTIPTIQAPTAPQWSELNTGDASTFVQQQTMALVLGEVDPNNPAQARNLVYGHMDVQAIACDPTTDEWWQDPNANRRTVIVANIYGANGIVFSRNLVYVLEENGSAIQRPGTTGGPRVTSDIMPLGALFDPAYYNAPAAPANAADVAETQGYIGKVTGLAVVNNQYYAVTERGDLWRVDIGALSGSATTFNWGFAGADPSNQPKNIVRVPGAGPRLQFIAHLTRNDQTIPFTGLTAGPKNVEGGRYANMLFATDANGRMYAFDTQGKFQPIFTNGATDVRLGVSGAQGIAFSPVDFNLWHTTTQRRDDAGHGINPTLDGSRTTTTPGGQSFYFGFEDMGGNAAGSVYSGLSYQTWRNFSDRSSTAFNTYNLPGGAHGSLTTSTFSLKGYDPTDRPVLYFNYFLDTQNSQDYDGARVYISKDGADWFLVATNTDTNSRNDLVLQNPRLQELVDSSGTGGMWRQARVDLSAFMADALAKDPTGESLADLRLRFDFSTASDMEVGDTQTTGAILRGVESYLLMDGNTFQVDNSETFEFDMGYALVMPDVAGAAIPSFAGMLAGETVTVTDANNRSLVFEFDKGQSPWSTNTKINITDLDTSAGVAQKLCDTINSAFGSTLAYVDTVHPDRVLVPGAWNIARTGARRQDGSYMAPTIGVEGNAPYSGTGAAQFAGRVAYQADPDGRNEVYVTRPNTTTQTSLSRHLFLDGSPRYVTDLNSTFLSAEGAPSYSPDGNKIVFATARDGNSEIYVMNKDGTGQTRVTYNVADDVNPRFAPDGNRIVFASNRDGDYEIYVMNIDGTGLVKLTDNVGASDRQPMFSPDGSKIVFISNRSGENRLYLMNADGTGQRELISNPGDYVEPSFSPDGSKVVFSSTSEGTYQIYTIDINTDDIDRITNNPYNERSPSFTPDGSKIVFISDRAGGQQAYVMNANGSNPTSLGLGTTNFWGLRYSPDGKTLTYASDWDGNWSIYSVNTTGAPVQTNLSLQILNDGDPTFRNDANQIAYVAGRNGGNSEIWAMTAAGTGQTSVSRAFLQDEDVSYSPDGARVVFASARTGSYELYVMNVDGSNLMRLTYNAAGVNNRQPSFSRDGKSITFISTRDGNPDVYVMNANGTGVRRLTTTAAAESSPRFSPDGAFVVYSSLRNGAAKLFTTSVADPTLVAQLTSGPGNDVEPVWNAAGTAVVFASNRSGNYDIYSMDMGTGVTTRLTSGPADKREPVFSADGSMIAYSSYQNGNWEIYTMKPDGTGATRVTSNAVTDAHPAFNPANGNQLAFITRYDGDTGIHVINTDGKGEFNLSKLLYQDTNPVYSPDGSKIAFSSSRDGIGHNQVYTVNADGSGLTNLSTKVLNDQEYAYSPDGSQIVFAAKRNGGDYDLYLMNADGTNQRLLFGNNNTTTAGADADDRYPSFSPDGKTIIFSSKKDGADFEIYTLDLATGATDQLTFNTTDDIQARYSPDGKKIVFTSRRSGNDDIWIMNADGTTQRNLSNSPSSDVDPVFNPVTGQIVFASNRDGDYEIYAMDADYATNDPWIQLTNNSTADRAPSVSKDGTQILFTSDRGEAYGPAGDTEVYVMNADGTGQTPLTNTPSAESLPQFSPAGNGKSQLAFFTNRDGYNAIYVMQADGTQPVNLSNKLFNDAQPSFSPDGSKIVFQSQRDGDYNIYAMNANGTGQIQWTTSPGDDMQPSYSADGSKVVFTSTRDGNAEIYWMDASPNGAQNRRTIDAADDFNPAFSPDGSKIVFASMRGGSYGLYTMNVDGTDPLPIPTIGGSKSDPAWSPGGVSYGNLPVRISATATAPEVTQAIWQALEREYSGVVIQAQPSTSYKDGDGFRVKGPGGQIVSFEFLRDPARLADPNSRLTGAEAIDITDDTLTAVQVAQLITQAIRNRGIGVSQGDLTGGAGTYQGGQKDNRVLLTGQGYRFDVGRTNLTVQTVAGLSGTSSKWDNSQNYPTDLIHLINHQVTSTLPAPGTVPLPGVAPLAYSTALMGDHPSDKNYPTTGDRYNNFQRGQNNNYEGFYIDDLIIGFAERGEMVTGAGSDTSFSAVPFNTIAFPEGTIVQGNYQVEIRRSQDYGTYDATRSPRLTLTRSFDTNDRLTQAFTILAKPGSQIVHGDTFWIGDGINKVQFQFLDPNVGGTSQGVPIFFTGRETAGEMAAKIVDAINSVTTIKVTASVIGYTTVANGKHVASSNRVELFGAKWVDGIDIIVYGDNYVNALDAVSFPKGTVTVTPVADGNALRDTILGPGIRVVGDARLNGGPASTGTFTDGVNSGILLTTGDVQFAAGPNTAEDSGIQWSPGTGNFGDPDLDREFGLVTTEATTLEFDFESSGDAVYFKYVFGSEEYNEYVGSQFNDAFGFFLDGKNVALVPGTNTPVSINNVNEGKNSQYYVNNSLAGGGLFTQQIGYDGFTTVLMVAVTGLTPGLHTIKMAIADVGDKIFDSGVFIMAGTFTSEQQKQTTVKVIPMARGDENRKRDQGQITIEANQIQHTSGYGIVVAPDQRGSLPGAADNMAHPSSVLPLLKPNTERLVPGIMIENNVIAFNGSGGIHFSGDTDPAGMPVAAVPFGRIVNNTIYGQLSGSNRGTGILVDNNASPTILNNIVAGFDTGVSIDNSSNTSVLGATVYQNNTVNAATPGAIGVGTFPMQLAAKDPLFVNPGAGNFYPDRGSAAIDSSVNSLPDRPDLTQVRTDLGIPQSPILAPDYDLYGQLRIDDPNVAPPPGLGSNVFKDRGAIDRVDFLGPTSMLVDPQDNDAGGIDRDPSLNNVRVVGRVLTQFAIQLADPNGVGIDDSTVVSANLTLLKDGIPLTEGLDYFFNYNATNDVISLVPAAGVWMQSTTYAIVLSNGIRDLANNPIQPNRPDGTTRFTISLAGMDFGDAPDPTYPTLLANDGARHLILAGFYLGNGVTNEADGKPNADATGDQMDDGVVFETGLAVGQTVYVDVTASAPGKIDAWVDFTRDGNWNSPQDQIFASKPVVAGLNRLSFQVPAGATLGKTFTRFRLSSVGGLKPTGEAPDGEVEDYQVTIVPYLLDFGSAPDPTYPTLLANDGARHRLGSGLRLGPTVKPEMDGNPNATAADSDNDGVIFTPIVPGQKSTVTVNVNLGNVTGPVYVNAWMDFNGDGDWNDPGEQVLVSQVVVAGDNKLRLDVPSNAKLGSTFARFRLSSQASLSTTGEAPDGEVEDYQVLVITAPEDWGDAPDSPTAARYPTLKIHNGARATVDPDFHLGPTITYELDGQPNATATGDQGDDGVQIPDLKASQTATIIVNASQPGLINAWIDWNADGDWSDAGEQIFRDQAVVAGDNSFTITVPGTIAAGASFARFRLSKDVPEGRGLSFDGPAAGTPAPVGEVEDYMVNLFVGDATISGYKFNDRNADGVWDKSYTSTIPPIQLLPPGQIVMLPTDDGSTQALPLGFNFEFYGNTYQQFYINNNGNVTFQAPLMNYVPSGFPQTTPIIAPFWADVDTRGGGEVRMNTGISSRGNPIVQVDWIDVGYFARHNDKQNTFTLYIEDDPGGDIVAFVYHGMQWTTGDIDGINGFGGAGAQLGFDAGDMQNYLSIARPKSAQDLAALMSVGQYAFRFDPGTGTPGGAETGLAGVQVYLDLNNNGQLDPGEPVTTTRADDPATPGVNEAGYYEFTNLFPGTYTVREVVPQDWLQTLPNAAGSIHAVPGSQLQDGRTFSIGNATTVVVFEFDDVTTASNGVTPGHVAVPFKTGDTATTVAAAIAKAINNANAPGLTVSATAIKNTVVVGGANVGFNRGTSPLTNDSYGYSITVGAKEVAKDVNFGNYKIAHVSVDDVNVVEGNQGTTQVQVTLRFTDSFGAPVTVDYATHDGAATTADNDYQAASGTFAFIPQSTPLTRWDIKQLTRNLTNEYNYSVWDSRIVWQGNSGSDWDIYLYDDKTGETKQISQASTDNRLAVIHGKYVVWSGKMSDGDDTEIFLYNIDTGLITRLTDNAYDDQAPQVSDRYVTWWAQVGNRKQIFVYDLVNGGAPVNISNNAYDNSDPRVSGSNVVWNAFDGSDWEVFLYDGTRTRQITNNALDDRHPVVDQVTRKVNGVDTNFVYVAWEASNGTTSDIYVYDALAGGAPVRLTNVGQNTGPQISGSNLVWQAVTGTQSEIMYYDLANLGTTAPAQRISGAAYYHETPRIDGNRVVWHTYDGANWQVYYYEIGGIQMPRNISKSGSFVGDPLVSQSQVVWRSFVNGSYQVFRAVEQEPEIKATLTLTVNGDLKVEPDEAFLLNLLNANLATIDRSQARITILNDDGSMDFGDAPAPYPTLLADNGARHIVVPGIHLGANVTTELDGKPGLRADGDAGDDGVTFNSPLMREQPVTVTVNASAKGFIDAWVDFNGDGDWNDPGEQVFTSQPVASGDNALTFNVPRTAALGTSYARFRYSTAGGLAPTGTAMDGEVEDYAVTIVGNVQLVNRQVVATGSSGNDVFKFWAGSKYIFDLNGMVYKFNASTVDTMSFDGGAGRDLVYAYGGPGNETANLYPDHGTFGSDRYTLTVTNVEGITAAGGGGTNVAHLYDSSGNDVFVARPTTSTMLLANGALLSASGFQSVYGHATGGGQDLARLYDSAADDTLIGTPTKTALSDGRYTKSTNTWTNSSYLLQAEGFAQVQANATAGGVDTAKLYDSPGNDSFEAQPTTAVMSGTGYLIRANGFKFQEGYSEAGGLDTARLYDSPGDEVFTASPTSGTMLGLGRFSSTATGFRYLLAYASNGGSDVARLSDSPDSDTYFAMANNAILFSDKFYLRTTDFDAVDAYSTQGADMARLYDSPGNDAFVGRKGFAKMEAVNGSYSNRANNFRSVYAYSSFGGTDTAELHDSAGNDTLNAYPDYVDIYDSPTTYYVRATRFGATTSFSELGGSDVANLRDSAGHDVFTAYPTYATMVGTGYSNRVNNFKTVLGYSTATGAPDEAHFYDSAAKDYFIFRVLNGQTYGQMSDTATGVNSTYLNIANNFANVYGHSTAGGDDQASLYDSALNELLEADTYKAKLSNVDLKFAVALEHFKTVNAWSSNSGDKKKVTGPLDYILNATGSWTDMP